MPDTDQIQEDEVLRRMLNTPHEKHKPLRDKAPPDGMSGDTAKGG